MSTYGSIIAGGPTLRRLLPRLANEDIKATALSRRAKVRANLVRWHEQHGSDAKLTAAHFGFSRSTVYVWLRRSREGGAQGFEDRSRRPKRVRQPTWSAELETRVLELRLANPRWGKDVLAPLLWKEGLTVSVSMVGRILSKLKRAGRLLPATLNDPCIVHHGQQTRPYAKRKPQEYVPLLPGDLVQVDSADIRWSDLNQVYKHFTARDYISRWDVLGVYGRATAITARDFLEDLLERAPFPVRAIQVDGGAEFKGDFEAGCAEKGILLFVLPPRSPKLNGRVERAQRTHKEEFYQLVDPPDSLADLRAQLLKQEQRYNTYRPHQALAYKTPQEWLRDNAERR
jgi:transposase InsO family protein